MNYDDRLEIIKRRDYKVVKANEIIQKAKFDLTTQELKVLAYCLSMVKPNDDLSQWYIFSIVDYCKVLGINNDSGRNYEAIKRCLKGLRDKSFWLTNPDGSETTVGWLSKATINKGSGKIKIKFDEDLHQYIIGLYENFTQYSLICTLPMQSQYSIRIYELLRSYAFRKSIEFDIDDLKRKLIAEHYVNFKDFRRKVIEVAIKEINTFTDIEVSYEPITKGRKVIAIDFSIRIKSSFEQGLAYKEASNQLDGQLSFDDYLRDKN